MNKYLKLIIIIISSLMISLGQISFFNNLKLNYLFLFLVIILILFKYNLGIVYAFWIGLFLDIFNLKFFGFITLTLLITSYFINYLFLNYLTHKNLLTYLVLLIISFIFFNGNLVILNLLTKIFGISLIYFNAQKLIFFINQIIVNLSIFIILYVLFFGFKMLISKHYEKY